MAFRRNRRNRSNPIVTFLMGLALFFGSFGVLFFNEGRVDLSKVAKKSISVSSDSVNPSNDGELVAVSGVLRSSEQLGDEGLLAAGDYLQLSRKAEMFAWDETKESDEDSSVDRYSYNTEWTTSPENSNNFNNPNGHFNPPMPYDQAEFTVSNATVGEYGVNTNSLFFMNQEVLPLSDSMVLEGKSFGEHIFIGSGSLEQPEVGDIRIQYTAYPNNQQATVFGQQVDGDLRPFTGPKDSLLYRAYPTDRETAISNMRTEYLALLWAFRFGGLMMMWSGMALAISPLTNLLGAVPLVGNLGRTAINIVAFIIAFVLTTITVIISAILNSVVALIVIVLLVAGGLYYWKMSKNEEKTAVSAA